MFFEQFEMNVRHGSVVSCQLQFLTSSNDNVASSNPTSATAKPNQKNSRTKQTCNTGIAQRQSVYNIVGHIFRLQ